jgi:D-alanyl-lipoteichoic acid biosynthesis protein DltD
MALAAAPVAVGLFVAAALAMSHLARRAIHSRIDRLAPIVLTQKNVGSVVQRETFRRHDLLPVYGSSELVRRMSYRVNDFFAAYPTGFAVSPVGDRGVPPLITFLQLASVAEELPARKLVLFLTPLMFTAPIQDRDRAIFVGNYSRIQAGKVFFSSTIDRQLKRRAATQLLRWPEALAGDQFLRTAVEALRAEGGRARLVYRLLEPLGRLQNLVLEWADEAQVLGALATLPALRRPVARHRRRIDWKALIDSAESDYRRRANGHAFGFQSRNWDAASPRLARIRDTTSDARFVDAVRASARWESLELVLDLLGQAGADALVVSLPMSGEYLDHLGASAPARQEYYGRLRGLAARNGLRCLTLEELEYEPYMLRDAAHPSPKGWVALDQVIDAFFHDEYH